MARTTLEKNAVDLNRTHLDEPTDPSQVANTRHVLLAHDSNSPHQQSTNSSAISIIVAASCEQTIIPLDKWGAEASGLLFNPEDEAADSCNK